MKLGRKVLMMVAALGLGTTLTQVAQAKTGYHRTKTTTIKSKPYYVTNSHGYVYRENGSLTNFQFKKRAALKDHRESTWVATSKTVIKMHGKSRVYYYVASSDMKTKGWVWRGYLKPGKHNQRIQRDFHAKTENFGMARPGKLYHFGENPFNVRFNHGQKLSAKLTYQRQQIWTVYKYGKTYRYYYVVSTDKKVKGWVWHKYLKTGQVTEQTVKPTVKPAQSETSQVISGSGNSQTKPTESNQTKPEQQIPIWAQDDGKRERQVINSDDFEKYIRQSGRYTLPISIKYYESVDGHYKGVRKNATSIESKKITSDPYHIYNQFYGVVDGKQIAINTLSDVIPLNGDIIDCEDGYFISTQQPERYKKYQSHGAEDYVTEAPSWYQYHSETNSYSAWRYNLQTRQWDKVSQDHVPGWLD